MASNYSVTPNELSAIWRLILNSGDMSFSSARINKAVDDLVGLGEIRKAVANEAKAVAVYGGELATGRSIGTEFSVDVPEKIDERYFEGENLKGARTSERMADPARRRLKPVDDIPRDMMKLLGKSFKTVHGKRLFRVARNQYLESIGKPPINRGAAMRLIKNLSGLKGAETETPIPRSEFREAVRANKKDESRLGSTADPNARPSTRRPAHIPKTGMPLDVGDARFSPAEEAREAMSRLQSPPIPEKTVPAEGGKARTQRDDPESERLATQRGDRLTVRWRKELADLERRLENKDAWAARARENGYSNSEIKLAERQLQLKIEDLRKKIGTTSREDVAAKGSIASSIDVAREKAFGVLERVRGFSDRGRRKLFNIVREKMPATRAAAKKIKAAYERGKAVVERGKAVKLEKGDVKQAPGFTKNPPDIRVPEENSRRAEARRALEAARGSRGGQRVRVLGKAGLSPRILDEPAEPPARRGRQLGRPNVPPTGPGNELPVGVPDSRESLLEALREMAQSRRLREMQDMQESASLDAQARADESVRRFRDRNVRDRGGLHRLRMVGPEGPSPEILERAAARKKKGGRPVRLARGAEAARILRARKAK